VRLNASEPTLTEEQIREVMVRAGEIELLLRHRIEMTTEVSGVIAAAEEAGLSREAVLHAMQEHFELLGEPPKPGELVFAKSANGKFYAAEVLRIGDGATRVRFLSGGEAGLPMADIRPLSMVPGTTIVCNWPEWGAWKCSVLRYDEATRTVTASDNWGSQRNFELAEVQLSVRQTEKTPPGKITRFAWQTAIAFAAGGGAVGAALTWLLNR